MRIESLEAFGMPPVVLAALTERYGEELLPVQERAVRELDILGGGDGLVAAPTSAGKTLVAELAVLKTVVGGGRAIIVLPTRALVEDKVADLEDAYEGIGLRVVAGTRERREHEWALRRRDYDVAVVVYEKLASLLVSVKDYLDGVALVVLDELQTLSDPVRGWHGQWVLHCLSEVRGDGGTPQLLGLTADLGGAPGLAGQLGVAKVTDDVRPVPLRVGVLQGGVFHYRAAPDRPWERETWLHDSPADEWDEPDDVRRGQMRAAAAELLDQGRRVMCFLPSKHECHALARDLAEDLEAGDPPVLRRLAQLPETTAAARLAPLLARGIGVHHSDLPGDLRAVVEGAARAGELRCLVATTTLASGVNLPVDVVLVDPRRWTPGERGWVADRVSRSEFEAMAGRAGRLGPGERPERGDAALVAATALEAQGLMETYFDDRGGPEPAELDPAGLPLWLLRIAGRAGDTSIPDRAEELCAEGVGWAWDLLRERGLADGECAPTALGVLAATYGLSDRTVEGLCRWTEGLRAEAPDAEILAGLCELPSMRDVGFPPPRRLSEGASYSAELARRIHGEVDPPNDAVAAEGAARLALVLLDWLSDLPTREVELRYWALGGAISRLAQEAGRLAAAGARMLAPKGADPHPLAERVEGLADALSLDVPLCAADLGVLVPRGLPRDSLLALHRLGVSQPADLLDLGREGLGEAVPSWLAGQLLAKARRVATERRRAMVWEGEAQPTREGEAGVAPSLRLHRRRPNEATVGGIPVALTGLQYELLLALAQRPRECVPWDDLYRAMWDEGLEVQPEQISWHKRELLKRVGRAIDGDRAARLIQSVRGRGLMLDLDPQEVEVA